MLGYYYQQLAKCKALLGTIASTTSTLSSLEGTYQNTALSVAQSYNIDGDETKTHKRVIDAANSVNKVKNHLNNVTVPKVNARIAQLNALIAEELRRLAAAAAAAKRGGKK